MIPDESFFGSWWAVGRAETKIKGTLHLSADKGISLELLGGFSTDPWNLSVDKVTIHGEMDSGAELSLFGCMCVHSTLWSIAGARETYHPQMVVKGGYYPSADETPIRTLDVEFTYLPSWVPVSGFEFELPVPKDNKPLTIRSNLLNPIPLAAYEGTEISVLVKSNSAVRARIQRKVELTQRWFVRMESSEPHSLEHQLDLQYKISQFLTLAVQKRVLPKSI